MTDTTYNGWVNYETWNVMLWIDSEEGSSRYWREAAKEILEVVTYGGRLTLPPRAKACVDLAYRLKDEITEEGPDLGASCYSDLLTHALARVNWDDIAEHLIDEIPDDEEDEDE